METVKEYIKQNLPVHNDISQTTLKIKKSLEKGEQVLYHIPKGKISNSFIFTTKKLIVGDRSNIWGKDLSILIDEFTLIEITQNYFLFMKMDLMLKFYVFEFFVNKKYSDHFQKLLYEIIKWNKSNKNN